MKMERKVYLLIKICHYFIAGELTVPVIIKLKFCRRCWLYFFKFIYLFRLEYYLHNALQYWCNFLVMIASQSKWLKTSCHRRVTNFLTRLIEKVFVILVLQNKDYNACIDEATVMKQVIVWKGPKNPHGLLNCEFCINMTTTTPNPLIN